jgi:UDPglucose 6-dehydrogenase
MNITIIGTGYVGLVTGALFADRGNHVTCVDINQEIVDKLNNGEVHIYEPGLKEIVKRNRENGQLIFTTCLKDAANRSEIIFLAVGTPSKEDGSFSLEYLKKAANDLGETLQSSSGFKVIVCKSTVPQGTYKLLSQIINDQVKDNQNLKWAYVSNPETLSEGSAVRDFSKPDRIIIGTNSNKAFDIMKELYNPFNIKNDRIIRGLPADAELAKLFSNTALAARISMVNEFARIADVTEGADMDNIRKMVCSDSRIGYNFMFPSPGYGGSCFPKDIQGVVNQAKLDGFNSHLLCQIHISNEEHKNKMAEKIQEKLGTFEGKNLAIWGVTFKPNTDDMRDAPAIKIVDKLINNGATVTIYDPQDTKAKEIWKGDKIKFVNNKYEAVTGSDALILLTEWKEFDAPNFSKLKDLMKGNYLFDFRNRWLPEAANRNSFNYYGIGRNYQFLKS